MGLSACNFATVFRSTLTRTSIANRRLLPISPKHQHENIFIVLSGGLISDQYDMCLKILTFPSMGMIMEPGVLTVVLVLVLCVKLN